MGEEGDPHARTVDGLRRVIDIPADLEELDAAARRQVNRFLRWAKRMNAHESYVASHRRTWWAVGLREPAPILCTYMARRPPAFVRNLCRARHVNIAHGLYPREDLADFDVGRLGHGAVLLSWLHHGSLLCLPPERERSLVGRVHSHSPAKAWDTLINPDFCDTSVRTFFSVSRAYNSVTGPHSTKI